MGAKVTFKITTSEKLNQVAEIPGQLIFVKDTGQIFLDYDNERTCYTPSGINYLGIVDKEPTTKQVSIDGETITARLKDVVVYGKKEYMWRKENIKDSEGNVISTTEGWFEIGDEDSPEWNT